MSKKSLICQRCGQRVGITETHTYEDCQKYKFPENTDLREAIKAKIKESPSQATTDTHNKQLRGE